MPYFGPDDDQSPLLCARGLDQSGKREHLGASRVACPSKARLKSASVMASAGPRISHREQELHPWPCPGLAWAQGREVRKCWTHSAMSRPQTGLWVLVYGCSEAGAHSCTHTPPPVPARRDPEARDEQGHPACSPPAAAGAAPRPAWLPAVLPMPCRRGRAQCSTGAPRCSYLPFLVPGRWQEQLRLGEEEGVAKGVKHPLFFISQRAISGHVLLPGGGELGGGERYFRSPQLLSLGAGYRRGGGGGQTGLRALRQAFVNGPRLPGRPRRADSHWLDTVVSSAAVARQEEAFFWPKNNTRVSPGTSLLHPLPSIVSLLTIPGCLALHNRRRGAGEGRSAVCARPPGLPPLPRLRQGSGGGRRAGMCEWLSGPCALPGDASRVRPLAGWHYTLPPHLPNHSI